MKKLKLAVTTSSLRDVLPVVDAWALDTEGLAAWNNPGKFFGRVCKRTWQLMHIPTGTCIAAAPKREDIVQMADALDGVVDWTKESFTMDEYVRVYRRLQEAA